MVMHELKTLGQYFDAVKAGEKTYEVRKNDRFYQTGDQVLLVRVRDDGFRDQHEPPLTFTIGAILQGGQFGIEPGYCVFSLLSASAPSEENT